MRNLTFVPFLCLTVACAASTGNSAQNPEAEANTQAGAQAEAGPAASPASTEPAALSAAPEPAKPEAAKPEAAKPEAAKPSKTFSLVEQKLPLVIDLPEGAAISASTSRDKLGGADIDAQGLSLRIVKADARLATIASAKATLGKLAHRPAKSFPKEEKDLLVFDRGNGKPELGFVMLVKQGGVTFACQSTGGEASEALLEPALAACRTLKKAP